MSLTVIPKLTQIYYDTYANLPATGVKKPALAYATDRQLLYNWDGSAWQPITKFSGSGLYADIPDAANLPNGSLYYATDTRELWQVQGGVWVDISPVVPDVVMVRKTADEIVNNSNILQNDDHLFLAAKANEVWTIELRLRISNPPASDIKMDFSLPTGASGFKHYISGINDIRISHPIGTPIGLTIDERGDLYYSGVLRAIVTMGATAGNIQFQWAQNAAVAEDTIIYANSCLIAHKLA